MKRIRRHHTKAIRRPALAWASAPANSQGADLTQLGAQSYSFRNFDFEGSVRCMQDLGLPLIEYCRVHFQPDPTLPELESIKSALAEAGLSVPCFGVEGFSEDAEANRALFEFAQALGTGILSADPAPEAFDSLDILCEEFQIKIAIHNHGPGARYDGVEDTLKAVASRHPFVGACVDTGHSIRSGEAPHEVIEKLGARVHSVHLKDWIHGGEEQALGEGDMDLVAVARALKAIGFAGPIIMEYELDPDGPVPGMIRGLESWRAATEEA